MNEQFLGPRPELYNNPSHTQEEHVAAARRFCAALDDHNRWAEGTPDEMSYAVARWGEKDGRTIMLTRLLQRRYADLGITPNEYRSSWHIQCARDFDRDFRAHGGVAHNDDGLASLFFVTVVMLALFVFVALLASQ